LPVLRQPQRVGAGRSATVTSENVLSVLDAVFLHVESERTPMHMASVGLFEGAPLRDAEGAFRIEDARRLIASRLKLVPKLRQVAARGLLGEAPPTWVDDPAFDIADHVRIRHLPSSGTELELRQLCAELLSEPLDRRRPLWDLTFVDGLADGNIAVIERLHHSMADGLAAAELATVLLDLSPEPVEPRDEDPWIPATPLPVWRAAIEDVLRLGGIWVRATSWGVQTLAHPISRLREGTKLGSAITTLLTPKIIAPKSSLNVPITEARSVDFVRLAFAEMRDVAHAFDATVNDVLLAIVTGGLHRLLESRGEVVEKSELQALVPVGYAKAKGDVANSLSALFVRLPIGTTDPLDVLSVVSAEVKADKRRHQSVAASTLLHLLDPLPQSVLASLAGVVQHQPFFNVIITNVPGPPVPLYAMGARLLEVFPIVPLAGNQSMGVAAVSYEGHLNLGVLTDPVTCPDVVLFCAGVQSTLQVLVDRSRGAACR
jgi:diacylglycerol O-acyltransferase